MAQVGEVRLAYQSIGRTSDPALLLVMGLGGQLIHWPDEVVARLCQQGFRVIRFDNRDVGLSQGFDRLGQPNVAVAALRHRLRLKVNAPYRVADMAADALGVLDALGIERAHVCGASMGGMIAQHLAAKHPLRVKSLTLIMTTSGARHLLQPKLAVVRALLSRPRRADLATYTAHMSRLLSVIGSPGFRPDPQRVQQRLQASFERAYRPTGTARQLVAVVADGDRSPLLHRIVAPTRVIHGDDTGVKLRMPGSNRTTKAHLWACIGDADYPYVVFDFMSDYTADGPKQFLAGYKGYFQADALAHAVAADPLLDRTLAVDLQQHPRRVVLERRDRVHARCAGGGQQGRSRVAGTRCRHLAAFAQLHVRGVAGNVAVAGHLHALDHAVDVGQARVVDLALAAEQRADVVRELGVAAVASWIDVGKVILEVDPGRDGDDRAEHLREPASLDIVERRVVRREKHAAIEKQSARPPPPSDPPQAERIASTVGRTNPSFTAISRRTRARGSKSPPLPFSSPVTSATVSRNTSTRLATDGAIA